MKTAALILTATVAAVGLGTVGATWWYERVWLPRVAG